MVTFSRRRALVLASGFVAASILAGCTSLKPAIVPVSRTITTETQFERGQPRPVIDGIGWVWGIPAKIMMWDRRVDNHRVSPETEERLREYVAVNDLDDVKVRINQYAPIAEWRRLGGNKQVSPGWRYTLGALHTLGYTVFPGRIFGGDRYNPYTNSLYVYSDAPPMSIVEAAYAKDVRSRELPGTYAAVQDLPLVGLWHETIATRDALDYTYHLGKPEDWKEAECLLYPRFGSRVGGAVGSATGAGGLPTWLGAGGGHVVGHLQGRRPPPEMARREVPQPVVNPTWRDSDPPPREEVSPGPLLEDRNEVP